MEQDTKAHSNPATLYDGITKEELKQATLCSIPENELNALIEQIKAQQQERQLDPRHQPPYFHKLPCRNFTDLALPERWQTLAEFAFEKDFNNRTIQLDGDNVYPFWEGMPEEEKSQRLAECRELALKIRKRWDRPAGDGWQEGELAKVKAWLPEARRRFEEWVNTPHTVPLEDVLLDYRGQSSETNWFAGSQTDRQLLFADFIDNPPVGLEKWWQFEEKPNYEQPLKPLTGKPEKLYGFLAPRSGQKVNLLEVSNFYTDSNLTSLDTASSKIIKNRIRELKNVHGQNCTIEFPEGFVVFTVL